MKRAIIHWKQINWLGALVQGHGEPIAYDSAEAWLVVMKQKYPMMEHSLVVLPE